jgi:hypothetical protein
MGDREQNICNLKDSRKTAREKYGRWHKREENKLMDATYKSGNREGINEHHLPIQVVPTACKSSLTDRN